MNIPRQSDRRRPSRPYVVILGTNEIASAVAVHLHRGGFAVALSHDPMPPVIRRKMAFHDALFGDAITVDGVAAECADTGLDVRAGLARARNVVVTELGLLDLIVVRPLDILVDARMQKYLATPDLRRLARLTIGLGPGFSAGDNCDIAVETRPAQIGRIIRRGPTDEADGIARPLGDRGAERFVYSEASDRWHSAIEIGTRVFKDFIVGHLGNLAIRAPFDGIVRGVIRDGTEVPTGVKLLEVDPRGRNARWTGIDDRGRSIAKSVTKAISIYEANAPERAKSTPYLVK